MSQSAARQRALEAVGAFEEDNVVCIGESKKVSGNGTAVYIPWPQPNARRNGVHPKSEVDTYVHGPTGVLLVVPKRAD